VRSSAVAVADGTRVGVEVLVADGVGVRVAVALGGAVALRVGLDDVVGVAVSLAVGVAIGGGGWSEPQPQTTASKRHTASVLDIASLTQSRSLYHSRTRLSRNLARPGRSSPGAV
jgi:hypothetical protein